jgi:hypothetical protein
MAAATAVSLLVAALVAIIIRLKVHVAAIAATPSGDPWPQLADRRNKVVAAAVIMASVVALPLFWPPFEGWWEIFPLLLGVFVTLLLVLMSIDLYSSFGNRVHGFIWGKVYLVTDPAVDDRLDPTSPNYDPAMDENDPAYDEDYFDDNALERRTPRLGVLLFFGSLAAIAVYVLISWLVAGLMALGGVYTDDNAAPTQGATTAPGSTASPVPGATGALPDNGKIAESTLDEATCAEVRAALPPHPTPKDSSTDARGVERCTGKNKWEPMTGLPAGVVNMKVTHSFRVQNGYHYMLCVFEGQSEPVLVRYVDRSK